MTGNEDAPYPVSLTAAYPDRSSRLLALLGIGFFLKVLLLAPHLVLLWFLGMAALVAAIIGHWAVLFTGRYPKSLFTFVVGVQRWSSRASAWLLGLTDRYPPFGLD